MPERIVVVGAGGFGRETLDVIEAAIGAGAPVVIVGVVDARPRPVDLKRLNARGVRYLGTEEEWLPTASGDESFLVAISSPAIRRHVTEKFSAAGLRAATVIHPRAVIGSQARIGRGVVVCSGVQISTNVAIGDHVHLNPASVIGHDAVLEDYVSVNPGAIVSGNVVVGRETLLGAGSVVLQGLKVGARTVVGAAACVTKAVDPGLTVVGVPARALVKGSTP